MSTSTEGSRPSYRIGEMPLTDEGRAELQAMRNVRARDAEILRDRLSRLVAPLSPSMEANRERCIFWLAEAEDHLRHIDRALETGFC